MRPMNNPHRMSGASSSHPVNDSSVLYPSLPRCAYHNGVGQCHMPVFEPSGSLCFKHAWLAPERPGRVDGPEDFSADLFAGLTNLRSAAPINVFLSRLLRLQASDSLPPRRAAVMAYTCNLLLRTLPALASETDSEPPQDVLDIPNPRPAEGHPS